MSFTVTLTTVLVMLAYSIPGYLLVRFKKIPASAISSFATMLVYVFTPFQIVGAVIILISVFFANRQQGASLE